ncbi:hemicentin-2-like isoform X2 [Daktulosphaira vitifoliae]|uniref:hemicentin-2-like isoform X2 n=1 Tax=Daktulosphaira vitifoliae TaxID=58002 RepID=UPI0021AA7A03|nr:hemicentin-2-like isoform X2 [Daktulosphaira vitifoliae]
MSAEECSRRLPQKSGKRRSTIVCTVWMFVLLALISIDKVHCRPNQVGNGDQNLNDDEGYLADSDNTTNDEDEDGTIGGGGNQQPSVPPTILTTGLNIEATEGTTVKLPCKLNYDSDTVATLWVNNNKTLCTEQHCFMFNNNRIKAFKPPNEYGYTLVIESVTPDDAGEYSCQLSVPEKTNITHTLRVTQPARITEIDPKVTSKLERMKGDPLYLQCMATGKPDPTIIWTKSNKKTLVATNENDNTTIIISNGPEVRIESLMPSDAGFYECKTENSHSADRKGFPLEVNYKPEIEVPKTIVNTGETYTATLACIVHSFPKPRVSWLKNDQPIEVIGTRVNSKYEDSRESGTNTYKLIIKHINSAEDFAIYRCRAENKHGFVVGDPILVTGSPAKPVMAETKAVDTNEVTSIAGRSTQVIWVVDSWSPVLEYQVEYKRQQDDKWKAFEHQPQVHDPENPSTDELKYRINYTFTMADSATYVARARARNEKGWSEWSNDAIFSEASTSDTASSTSYSAVNVCLTMAFALYVARHLGTNNAC